LPLKDNTKGSYKNFLAP